MQMRTTHAHTHTHTKHANLINLLFSFLEEMKNHGMTIPHWAEGDLFHNIESDMLDTFKHNTLTNLMSFLAL